MRRASVETSVWFSSGRLSRMIEFEEGIDSTVPMCYWVMNASRRPPKPSTNWNWVSIDHARTGGSTTSRGVFGFRNITPPSLERDPIRRSIAHILKYSERPNPCSPSFEGDHYTIHDQLSVNCLDKPVLFPSGFSYTGWGRRSLVPSELSQAFDLPSFLEWSDDFRNNLVPIQLFRVAIDAVLLDICPSVQPSMMSPRPRLVVSAPMKAIPLTLDRHWLEKLQLWLPGSWADIEISDKAVKSDDASVNFAPWNRRISLVLRSSPVSIAGFEAFALRRWRRNLFRSFVSYLEGRYGRSWALALVATRISRGLGSESRKRRRCDDDFEHRPNTGGGVFYLWTRLVS